MASTPDISELSESQQEALQTYTSVTDQDPLEAIPLLARSEWNVQIAITRFFEGEPTDDPIAEARAALPPTAARQAINLQYDDDDDSVSSYQTSSRRSNPNAVGRVSIEPDSSIHFSPPWILAVLFSPVTTLYRFILLGSSFLGRLFPFLPRLLGPLLGPVNHRPDPSRPSLAPADTARRFIRELSEKYDTGAIPFVESGFNLALDNAKRDSQFLLVILIPPGNDDTDSWIRETLCSSEFRAFLSEHSSNLLLWGGNVQDAEAYQVMDMLQCTKLPFVGLVCQTSDPSNSSSSRSSMTTVMRAPGPTPATKLATTLRSTMQKHQRHLDVLRAERNQDLSRRTLRQEQDSAYERSLAQDRERARQRKEELEKQALMEKEALRRAEEAEQREMMLERWKRWRARKFIREGEPKSGTKGVTRLSIRLADGAKVIRAFRGDKGWEEVYAFVECRHLLQEGLKDAEEDEEEVVPNAEDFEHGYGFRLVSSMPRKVYGIEKGVTVADGVGRGANLIVELLDEDEDENEGVNENGE